MRKLRMKISVIVIIKLMEVLRTNAYEIKSRMRMRMKVNEMILVKIEEID
jgi:hypothetical protein